MNDTTKTPLQIALDDLEAARIGLITEMSGEAATVNQALAELRQKAGNLRSQHIELTHKNELEKAQAVAKQFAEAQAAINAQERVAADFDARLRDAREGRAIQLQHLRLKVDHETRVVATKVGAEEAFRKAVSEDMRKATNALLASTTPEHARHVILDALGIAEQQPAAN